MAKEEVLIGVKVDTKQAQKSLGELEKETENYSKKVSSLETQIFNERKKLLDATTKEQKEAHNKRIKTLQGEKNAFKALASEGTAEVKKLNKSLKTLEKDINGVDKSLKKAGETVKKGEISKGLTDASGAATALGGSMGKAAAGVKVLGNSFKLLLANPIILVIAGIVAGVTALFKAFTSTKEGAEQLDAIMAGVSATFDVFRDLLVDVTKGLISVFKDPKKAVIDLADTIQNYVIKQFNLVLDGIGLLGSAIKKVFEGDFSGALDDAAEGAKKLFIETNPLIQVTTALGKVISDTTEEIKKESAAAYNLSLQLANITDRERELSLERAKANRQLAEARLIAADESKSTEERIVALEKINKIEDDLLAKEIALAKEKLENIKATNALSDSSKEALDAEYAAAIAVENLQTSSFNKKKGNERELTRLRNQKAADEKAKAKIKSDADKAAIDAELAAEKQKAADKLAIDKKTCESQGGKWEDGKGCSFVERDAAKREANIETAKTAATELANAAASAVFEAQAANLEREKEQKLNAVTQTQKRELDIVNARLEQGLINNEQAEQQRKKIEEDAAKTTERIEKEAFKKNQKMQIQQAIANGALAITNILATVPKFDFGVSTAILAGAAVASTALQVATIKSQKFAKGGVIKGNSHDDGGVPIQGGRAEVEGGEVIINKASSKMFRNELSIINQAGGGVKFANGGVLSGGANPADNNNTMTAQLERLIEVSERPTRAVVSETEITDSQNRISNIENRSSF